MYLDSSSILHGFWFMNRHLPLATDDESGDAIAPGQWCTWFGFIGNIGLFNTVFVLSVCVHACCLPDSLTPLDLFLKMF